jgi:hypothetical protein
MNKKYTFRTTANEDYSKPNNNYSEETEYIVTDGVYDFSDYLSDQGVAAENVDDKFYVVDDDGERTGEAYWIISEEDTDEELQS